MIKDKGKCSQCFRELTFEAFYCCDAKFKVCPPCAAKRCKICRQIRRKKVQIPVSVSLKPNLHPPPGRSPPPKREKTCICCKKSENRSGLECMVDPECKHPLCHECVQVFHNAFFTTKSQIEKDTGAEVDMKVEMFCGCEIQRQSIIKYLRKYCVYCHSKLAGTSKPVYELRDHTLIHTACLGVGLAKKRDPKRDKDYQKLIMKCQSCDRPIDGMVVKVGHNANGVALCSQCQLQVTRHQKIYEEMMEKSQKSQNSMAIERKREKYCVICKKILQMEEDSDELLCTKCYSQQFEHEQKNESAIENEKPDPKIKPPAQIEKKEQPNQVEAFPESPKRKEEVVLPKVEKREEKVQETRPILIEKKVEAQVEEVESKLISIKEVSLPMPQKVHTQVLSKISSAVDESSKLSDQFLPPKPFHLYFLQEKVQQCKECGLKAQPSALLKIMKLGKGYKIVEDGKDQKHVECTYWCFSCYSRLKLKMHRRDFYFGTKVDYQPTVRSPYTSVPKNNGLLSTQPARQPRNMFTQSKQLPHRIGEGLTSSVDPTKATSYCTVCQKMVPANQFKKGPQVCYQCELKKIL